MKKLLSFPIGEKGKVALTIDAGNFVLDASYTDRGFVKVQGGYPVDELLKPLKEKFIDKLKAKIPGELDDAIIEKAWKEALEFISEEAK